MINVNTEVSLISLNRRLDELEKDRDELARRISALERKEQERIDRKKYSKEHEDEIFAEIKRLLGPVR